MQEGRQLILSLGWCSLGKTKSQTYPYCLNKLSSMTKRIHPAAKKRSQDTAQEERETVVAYYEKHKGEFKSKTDAAYRIFKQNLVSVRYSTIYTWLDKHIREIRK